MKKKIEFWRIKNKNLADSKNPHRLAAYLRIKAREKVNQPSSASENMNDHQRSLARANVNQPSSSYSESISSDADRTKTTIEELKSYENQEILNELVLVNGYISHLVVDEETLDTLIYIADHTSILEVIMNDEILHKFLGVKVKKLRLYFINCEFNFNVYLF